MKLYYEDRGEGPAILLLHGFTGSSADWLPFLPSLPEGHRYIIPDQRGHGKSLNPEKSYTHGQSARDVFALLDELGVENCTACGMSGGAMALLHMATQQPERIDAMVLVSPTTHYTDQARKIMDMLDPDNQPEEAWEAMRLKHPRGDEQILDLWKQARAFRDDYQDMAFKAEDLASVQARTLIVHGDRDPLFPLEIPVMLYKSISESLLWIIPGGEHVPVFGDHQQLFFATISRFLTAPDARNE